VLYPQNDDEGVGRNGKARMGMEKEGGKGEGESGRRIKGGERRERGLVTPLVMTCRGCCASGKAAP